MNELKAFEEHFQIAFKMVAPICIISDTEMLKPGIKVPGWHIYSVQFSRSVMSDSLRPHELQPARPPCQSPTHNILPYVK